MKVSIENYNQDWPREFEKIKSEIKVELASLNTVVEHVGSTSIPDLKAKPVIDVLVGICKLADLDLSIQPLIAKNYIYYEKYNPVMPYRRFFVKLKSKPNDFHVPSTYFENDEVPNELNDYKLAHIHILEYNSPHWIRHIAFRDYLLQHETSKLEYEQLKVTLSKKEWKDGNEYNAAKNDFIKATEKKAIEWYKNTH